MRLADSRMTLKMIVRQPDPIILALLQVWNSAVKTPLCESTVPHTAPFVNVPPPNAVGV